MNLRLILFAAAIIVLLIVNEMDLAKDSAKKPVETHKFTPPLSVPRGEYTLAHVNPLAVRSDGFGEYECTLLEIRNQSTVKTIRILRKKDIPPLGSTILVDGFGQITVRPKS